MKILISKKWLFMLLLLPTLMWGQKKEQQTDAPPYKTLIPEEKQGLLKNVSMIANMNFGFRNEFYDGDYTGSRFRNEQFRLEIRGMVHEKVYFRFRDRYTRASTSESIDNISRSLDLAYIRVDATDKFSVSLGKMCADWGGFEFDYNPIDIYEYSDIIEFADNFLTGVGFSYAANTNNSFTVQVLNSRTENFDELYGPQPDFTESKAPLAFVGNWRGSLFDGKVKTIWSYSLFTEAEGTFMNYIALGTEVNLGKFVLAYDYKWSNEQIDRTGIISETVPDDLYPYALAKTLYKSHWVHAHYKLNDKINFSLFGMLDIADWNDDTLDPQKTSDHVRTAYGFVPTFEYYPFKDLNLRFFANYVGRVYKYSDYAKDRFNVSDYTTGRFVIGFVSPLHIF